MDNSLDFTNETIEKLLVKRCLTDKKYMTIISGIYDSRWIEDNQEVSILMGISLKYFNKYHDLPNKKILNALVAKYCEIHKIESKTEIISKLSEISSLNLGISDEVLKKNLQDYILSKAMFWAISDNYKQIERDKNVDRCLDRFNSVRKMTFEDTDLGMNYFSADDMAKHWEYIMNPEAKVKTLWSGMDTYTNGGFLKEGKDLVVFCGQAGLGKSLFLSNLTKNFLMQNLSVAVISLEMSQDVYAKRFDAHISENNVNTLNTTKEDSVAKIRNFYSRYPNANLYIKEYPPRTIRVSDIESYLTNLKENGVKVDVIVIDYLNLVLSDRKSDNMYESVLDVAEKLRAISYKFAAPVITATQATTQGMNNENIGMEHISESRGIAHTADELFMLFQMDDDREQGIINVRIAKNRAGGQVGKVIKFKMNSQNLVLSDATFLPGNVPQDDMSEAETIINNITDISSDMAEF